MLCMATAAATRRNPRRSAEANRTTPKRKTRRGTAKSGRQRAQARAERRSWHLIDALGNVPAAEGLPSNATRNQRMTYVSPAAATAARDELLARLG